MSPTSIPPGAAASPAGLDGNQPFIAVQNGLRGVVELEPMVLPEVGGGGGGTNTLEHGAELVQDRAIAINEDAQRSVHPEPTRALSRTTWDSPPPPLLIRGAVNRTFEQERQRSFVAATFYKKQGLRVVPIPTGSKGPKTPNWNQLDLTLDEIKETFDGNPQNVGVILGKASGLLDCDLDCAEAVRLAPRLLPKTVTFGRRSKRESHHIFVCDAGDMATVRFEVPGGLGRPKRTLNELRANGGQTVFPGSVHTSGEDVEFDASGVPAVVPYTDLLRASARLAAAALLAQNGFSDDEACELVSDPIRWRQLPSNLLEVVEKWLGEVGAMSGHLGAESAPTSPGNEPVDADLHGGIGEPNSWIEVARTEPVIKAALVGQTFGRDAWRFVADNIAAVAAFQLRGVEDAGLRAGIIDAGKSLFHELSKVDRRPHHGYNFGSCEAQFRDSIKRAEAAARAGERTSFVAYRTLEKHGVPPALSKEGQKVARSPGDWILSKLTSERVGAAGGSAGPVLPVTCAVSRPVIAVENRQLREVVADAIRALLGRNSPAKLFRRGGQLVEIKTNERELRVVTADGLAVRLSDAADLIKEEPKKASEEPEAVYPPQAVVRAILADPGPGFPVIEGIAGTPYFAADGQLVIEQGYNEVQQIYLLAAPGLEGIDVPPAPTDAEVAKARNLLLDELLVDFPFASQADRAHAVALLISPFVRRMIDGSFPLFVLEAPESGSGKSLLGDLASIISTGSPMDWRTFPTREEEREKAIFTALANARQFVAFDNAKGTIDSPALESALTSWRVSARLLGTNRDASVSNSAVWVISANNATMSRDLTRRSVRVRIDPKMENPEERAAFRHPEIKRWTLENRVELVWACLTLVRNGVVRLLPYSGRKLGSFEEWSVSIGRILGSAGISGFMDPGADMRSADPQKDEAAAFFQEWHRRYGEEPVSCRELVEKICAPPEMTSFGERERRDPLFLGSVLANPGGSRSVKLGVWMKKSVGKVIGGLRLEEAPEDKHAKVNHYRVVPLDRRKLPSPDMRGSETQPTTVDDADFYDA